MSSFSTFVAYIYSIIVVHCDFSSLHHPLFLFAGKERHAFNTEAGLHTVDQRLEFRAIQTMCIKYIFYIAPLQIRPPTLLSNLTAMAATVLSQPTE